MPSRSEPNSVSAQKPLVSELERQTGWLTAILLLGVIGLLVLPAKQALAAVSIIISATHPQRRHTDGSRIDRS